MGLFPNNKHMSTSAALPHTHTLIEVSGNDPRKPQNIRRLRTSSWKTVFKPHRVQSWLDVTNTQGREGCCSLTLVFILKCKA